MHSATSNSCFVEIKKRRGGVKKKKKKKHCHFQRKYIVPRIGNLFKPLNVGVDDTPDTVAREISYRLNEVRYNPVDSISTENKSLTEILTKQSSFCH